MWVGILTVSVSDQMVEDSLVSPGMRDLIRFGGEFGAHEAGSCFKGKGGYSFDERFFSGDPGGQAEGLASFGMELAYKAFGHTVRSRQEPLRR